jgi:hypothetical protein
VAEVEALERSGDPDAATSHELARALIALDGPPHRADLADRAAVLIRRSLTDTRRDADQLALDPAFEPLR